MKAYVLMEDLGIYESSSVPIAVCRDRSKLEQLKAEKKTKERYAAIKRRVYLEIDSIILDDKRILAALNDDQHKRINDIPQDYSDVCVKYDQLHDIVWDELAPGVCAKYGVQPHFVDKNDYPEDPKAYTIVELEELE